MKLYILFNSKEDKVVAISEEKDYIAQYILQNNFGQDYGVSVIKKELIINRYLTVYDDLLLEEFDDMVLTAIERRIVFETMAEETDRMKCTIDDLTKMIETYNLGRKDSAILKAAIKVLRKNSKPKRLSILLGIKEFVLSMFNKKNIADYFKQEYQQKDDRYYIQINIEE